MAPIKFLVVLPSVLLGVLPLVSCGAAETKAGKSGKTPKLAKPGEAAPGVMFLGRMSDARITESSGLAASRRHAGVFWTHNDGRRQFLYAIDRAGTTLASFPVAGVKLEDWEDIALDDAGHLYIADTGNNDGQRTELVVHEIDEPDPKTSMRALTVLRTWRLRFPGEPFDCEALFVWQGQGYVISKVLNDARAQIFRFPLKNTTEPHTLELVATTKIDSPVTGADLSADGQRLAIVAKNGAYLYRVDGDPARADKGKPHQTKFKHDHIEACAFVPDGLLATSEKRELYLFTDGAFLGK